MNRQLYRIYAALFIVCINFNLSFAATNSLTSGAASDRRMIAKAALGSLGWLVLVIASIIAIIDFFNERDMRVLIRLSTGFLVFFVLARWMA